MSDDLKTQVKLLDLESGDVVLVHAEVMTGELRRSLTAMLPPDVGAIFLRPGESVEMVSEEAMKEAGWVRASSACKCAAGGCSSGGCGTKG